MKSLVLLSVTLCVAVLTFGVRPVSGSLSVLPVNVAVVAGVGSTAVLPCESALAPPNARVLWAEFITSSFGSIISDNDFILSHPNGPRYRIVHDHDRMFHLEISNVQLSDGGTYTCQNTMGMPPDPFRGEAELIVLASTPNCTNTSPNDGNVLEGQVHTIECTIFYQGGMTPKQTWSGPGEYILAEGPPNPTSVWSGVQYTVDRVMDTRAFQCETNFTARVGMPSDVASNAPTLTHLYRAPQIFVFWGPKNTYHSPVRDYYVVGDVLTCFTDAMPPPFFQWQNMRTLQIFISQSYTITADHLDTNTTLRCQAQNLINGFVYSENHFVFAYTPVPTTPTTTPTTPSTSTHPAEADCTDISGHWRAQNPFADMLLEMDDGIDGSAVIGLFKNRTDTVWVEVIGTVKRNDWSLLGLTAIWPHEQGVTSMSAECHKCHGVETIIGDGMWRSVAESVRCGESGQPGPHPTHFYTRVSSTKKALEQEFDVYKPSSISRKLGVNLKKK